MITLALENLLTEAAGFLQSTYMAKFSVKLIYVRTYVLLKVYQHSKDNSYKSHSSVTKSMITFNSNVKSQRCKNLKTSLTW